MFVKTLRLEIEDHGKGSAVWVEYNLWDCVLRVDLSGLILNDEINEYISFDM